MIFMIHNGNTFIKWSFLSPLEADIALSTLDKSLDETLTTEFILCLYIFEDQIYILNIELMKMMMKDRAVYGN